MYEDKYQIKHIQEHFEAFDIMGRFIVSGDTKQEVLADLSENDFSQIH